MKYFSYILLFTFSLIPLFSFSENRQSKVDSLQLVLQHAHLDTNNVLTKIELSSHLYEMDEYEKALEYAYQAKSLSEKLNFKSGIASAYRRIGAIYTEQGNYPQALESLLLSLHIYEHMKSTRGIFMVNNNIGTLYYFQKDYDKALDYYFKAYDYNNSDGLTCANLGMVYIDQENNILALKYFFQALDLYKKTENKNGISSSIANIGYIYELENNLDEALEYYFKSLKIKKEINDNMGIADQLGGIGDIYYKKKQYVLALNYELQSLALAKNIGYINSIMQTEETLSNIYMALHQPAQAFEHYKQFTVAKDNLFNAETTKRITGAEKDFEFQKKEEHIKVAQDKKDILTAQEKERQRIIIYSVSIGLFLVLLLALFIFKGYRQKQKVNIIISEQKKLVDEKNKDITDSIQYASRIQKAIMLPENLIKGFLPEHFLLWKSRDAVSGDFYFIEQYQNKIIVAIADATGHGTNGCLISILGSNILSEIVKEGETIPSKILDKLNKRFNEALHKSTDDSIRDGMDISLICLDMENNTAMWAGANNPLWIIRSGEITEMKADKLAIGQTYKEAEYTNHEIQLQKEDILYAFSDGICDQFNSDGKKFMKKRLRELLLSVQNNNMIVQKEIINSTIEGWKQATEQTDDILIMGIKI